MGQTQGKETATPSSSTLKPKTKKTVKGRPSSSQVSTESDGGAFTLPWDLRGGGMGNGPSLADAPPPPPAENGQGDVTSKCYNFCSYFST